MKHEATVWIAAMDFLLLLNCFSFVGGVVVSRFIISNRFSILITRKSNGRALAQVALLMHISACNKHFQS